MAAFAPPTYGRPNLVRRTPTTPKDRSMSILTGGNPLEWMDPANGQSSTPKSQPHPLGRNPLKSPKLSIDSSDDATSVMQKIYNSMQGTRPDFQSSSPYSAGGIPGNFRGDGTPGVVSGATFEGGGGGGGGGGYGSGAGGGAYQLGTQGQQQKIANAPEFAKLMRDQYRFEDTMPWLKGQIENLSIRRDGTDGAAPATRTVSQPNRGSFSTGYSQRSPVGRTADSRAREFARPSSGYRTGEDPMSYVDRGSLTGGRTGPAFDRLTPITTRGVMSEDMIDRQANALRATSDQQVGGAISELQQSLAGQGYGTGSPLENALAANLKAQAYGDATAAEQTLRADLAAKNAEQLLASQVAAANQQGARDSEITNRWAQGNQFDLNRLSQGIAAGNLANRVQNDRMGEELAWSNLGQDFENMRLGNEFNWGQLGEQSRANIAGENQADASLRGQMFNNQAQSDLGWAGLREQSGASQADEYLKWLGLQQDYDLQRTSQMNPLFLQLMSLLG